MGVVALVVVVALPVVVQAKFIIAQGEICPVCTCLKQSLICKLHLRWTSPLFKPCSRLFFTILLFRETFSSHTSHVSEQSPFLFPFETRFPTPHPLVLNLNAQKQKCPRLTSCAKLCRSILPRVECQGRGKAKSFFFPSLPLPLFSCERCL